jgi:hypothetical protein
MYHIQQKELVATRDAAARTFLRDPNVQGVAIGYRNKDGMVTRDLTLRVYVTRKRPARLLRGSMIPPRLPLVKRDGTLDSSSYIETDVHEVGRFLPAGAPRSGDLVTVSENGLVEEEGTVCLAFRNVADGQGYLLTAGHVVAPKGSNNPLLVTVESDPQVVGQDPVVLPLIRGSDLIEISSNNLDAAICRIDLPPDAPIQTHNWKKVRGLEDPAPEGDRVYKMFSRKLGEVVSGSHPDVRAIVRKADFPSGNWAYLTNTFTLTIDGEQGDSGSLLYEELDGGGVVAVGMLIAVSSDDGPAIFHPIGAVLDAFLSLKSLELRPEFSDHT